MSEQETQFADGMFFKRPHDNAPEFVKGHLAIKVDEAIEMLQKHKNADGWVNLNLHNSKQGKLYLKVNTWEPPKKNEEITKEDAPF